jgi:predicted lipoprotein with Yx(FWY)xxD motif
MHRLTVSGIAVFAALVISACGGGGSSSSGGSTPASSADTVSVRQLSGVGRVLVDQSGKPLYSSDLEASGKIVCSSGACTTFWKPLTLNGGKPTAAAGAGKLGLIKRPDGSMQVTANGKPLYTFAEDSPGKSKGDGFTDDFDGHHFTWHVVQSGGKTSSSSSKGAAPSTNRSGGYGY